MTLHGRNRTQFSKKSLPDEEEHLDQSLLLILCSVNECERNKNKFLSLRI